MPGVARQFDKSTGHGPYPPTPCVSQVASTVRANGRRVQKVGSEYVTHKDGTSVHPQSARKVASGSGTVRVEGSPIARIGDPISCGDSIGQCSGNVYAGG